MGSRYINILFFSLIFINAGFAQAVKLATSATIIEHNRFVVTSENNVIPRLKILSVFTQNNRLNIKSGIGFAFDQDRSDCVTRAPSNGRTPVGFVTSTENCDFTSKDYLFNIFLPLGIDIFPFNKLKRGLVFGASNNVFIYSKRSYEYENTNNSGEVIKYANSTFFRSILNWEISIGYSIPTTNGVLTPKLFVNKNNLDISFKSYGFEIEFLIE